MRSDLGSNALLFPPMPRTFAKVWASSFFNCASAFAGGFLTRTLAWRVVCAPTMWNFASLWPARFGGCVFDMDGETRLPNRQPENRLLVSDRGRVELRFLGIK